MILSTKDRTEQKETVEIIAHVAKNKDDKKKAVVGRPFCTVLDIVKSIDVVNLHKGLNIFNGTGRWADL